MSTETKTKSKDKTIVWQAPEFPYVEKTIDWYWIVGIIGLLSATMAYMLDNWTFAILVILSTTMLMFLSRHKPKVIKTSLNKKEITIDNKEYKTKQIVGFNIDDRHNKLVLQSNKTYAPLIISPLPDKAPVDKIIDIFEQMSIEQNEDLLEPTIEVFMRNLGF